MLVEKLRLSSYLGAYGAGRTLRTVSLLPGQKDTISVKTYRTDSVTATQASSVLDSYTTESQDDLESTLSREQSNKKTADESLKWNVSGSASWGFGAVSLSAGASGGSNAAREELAKNISNAVQKHAAKASSKRDIDIKTSKEDKSTSGEELSTQSVVENINLSRTLNFVFRQMNQEFITVLHLVDVRVAYVRIDHVDGSRFRLAVSAGVPGTTSFTLAVGAAVTPAIALQATAAQIKSALEALGPAITGAIAVVELAPGTFEIELEREGVALAVQDGAQCAELEVDAEQATYREVTLSQLDGLLRSVIQPDRISHVRDAILTVLSNVFDYQDEPHAMVEERELHGIDGAPLPNGTYLRVPKGLTSAYEDPATGTTLTVPGVILATMRNVMRTDGILCDALLGQGEALDTYSRGLQDEVVRAKRLENDGRKADVERERLGIQAVGSGNADRVALYARAFPERHTEALALVTAPNNGSDG
jgi:hypothetical protein